MTIDPKIHAIATMFVDQLLDEIGPNVNAFGSVERNAYIARVGTRMQWALEDECHAIRKDLEARRPF